MLPKVKFVKNHVCEACQRGKQIKTYFQSKRHVSTTRPLQLIHMDLFGPIRTQSLRGKFYGLVIVDNYSRFTWVYFLANKSDCFQFFKIFCKKVETKKGVLITSIRSDHGKEFENINFEDFCNKKGISHNFSALRTPK